MIWTRTMVVVAGLAWAIVAHAAPIEVIPVTGGQFGGMRAQTVGEAWVTPTAYYHNLAASLDNQPTGFDGVTGEPIGQPETDHFSTGNIGYPGGWGYLDFGEDWASYRITDAWTQSRGWAHGPATPYTELYWADDTATWIHSTGATPPTAGWPMWNNYIVIPNDAIAETQINFITQATNDGTDGGGDFTWRQDLALSQANAITPQGRYLIMHSPDTMTPYQELVVGGFVVPEPTTLAVFALGGMAALRRRR